MQPSTPALHRQQRTGRSPRPGALGAGSSRNPRINKVGLMILAVAALANPPLTLAVLTLIAGVAVVVGIPIITVAAGLIVLARIDSWLSRCARPER